MSPETLSEYFRIICNKYHDKKAISFYHDVKVETTLTYEELHRDASQMAHAFLDKGVKKEDRVILILDKSVMFVIAHLALQQIGAISVPLNPGYKKSELSYLINDADPALILAGLEQTRTIKTIDKKIW